MEWILIIDWAAKLILLGLVGLSIWSIGIILDRRRFFKTWKNLAPLSSLKENWDENLNSENDPRIEYLNEIKKVTVDAFDNLFVAYVNESQKKWGKGLSVLGTLGSTTPFVGLLGTILGIVVSFGELAKGSVEMKSVMFSLAEALVLTAVGLAVAIPAVIAFNVFNKKINVMNRDLESIKELYKAKKKSE